MRLPLALTLALSFALCATSARAQRLDLQHDAPRDCPSRTTLLRQIADARGTSPRDDRALSATVTITPAAPRWRAFITTRSDGAVGERTLEARSCARLTQAVALVIALAIDSEAERTDASPAPPVATTVRAPVLFVDDGELPPALRPRPRRPVTPPTPSLAYGLQARLLVDAGSLPAASPGVSFGLALGGRTLLARVDATLFASRVAEGPRVGTRTTVGAWTVAALACARPHAAVELCAGVELTGMDARTEGFRQDGSDAALYLATPLRATFSLPLTRHFRVGISPELVVPWTRTDYRVTGVGVVHAVPAVIFREALVFEARWP